MNWDKIFNASLYPIIAMLLLQLVSFWSITMDVQYLLLLAGLILTILPTLIYAYAGYSAVKDRKFTIQEAAATGVLISIINTVASTILMLQIATLRTGGSGAYENTIFSAVALVSLVIGLVFNSFWGGLFAAIGGAIARKPIEDAQQKAKK